jgi:type I restriction enzyme S subunit
MNETLEAMARATFKDWFVDFGPTRAKVVGREPYLAPDIWNVFPAALDDDDSPDGWKLRPICDFCEVVYGAPYASKHFNSEELGLPLIRIRDLANHEPGVYTEQEHSKGHIIEPGDIVVGMDGEFRLHVWKGPKSWLNQRVCHFEPKAYPGASGPTEYGDNGGWMA